ncbi:MAG: AtpZ/AtpI family protein, partial [Selenomonadales bacterium]|nr:AtpZ/AtpI family protein [Selenomonadales bacterium]
GVGLGRGADCLLGAEPFGTVMGVLLGVGCAMRSVYCRVMKLK